MRRKKQKRKSKLGLPPGSLVFTGEQKMEQVDISVFNYSETFIQEFRPKSIDEVIKDIKKLQGNGILEIRFDFSFIISVVNLYGVETKMQFSLYASFTHKKQDELYYEIFIRDVEII